MGNHDIWKRLPIDIKLVSRALAFAVVSSIGGRFPNLKVGQGVDRVHLQRVLFILRILIAKGADHLETLVGGDNHRLELVVEHRPGRLVVVVAAVGDLAGVQHDTGEPGHHLAMLVLQETVRDVTDARDFFVREALDIGSSGKISDSLGITAVISSDW